MGGKEVSEAVVTVAWAAQQETELKALLAAEVLENDKLRKSVEVYKKMIEDLKLAADDDAAAATLNSDSASTELCQEPGTLDVSSTDTNSSLLSSATELGFSQEH